MLCFAKLPRLTLLCILCTLTLSLNLSAAPAAPVIDLRPSEPTAANSDAAKDIAKVAQQDAGTKAKETLVKPAQSTTESKVNSSSFKQKNTCSNSSSEHWQKNLVSSSFQRMMPDQANAGRLNQADYLFPQLLIAQLVKQNAITQPAFINESLPQTTAYNQHQIAEISQKIARVNRSQLVMSGEIIDMSMAHPEQVYNPSLYQRTLNQFFDAIEVKNRFEKRDRLFHFRVHLADGVTGETVFSQDYSTYGLWTLRGDVNFGSEKFWQTDYGQQIGGLVKAAARDLAEVIQCQPLKTAVEARPGQTQIILQSGANNGLKIGDTLSLYQVVMQASETVYQQSEMRLLNRNAVVEIKEVYPSHAVASVKGTTYLNGQFLAVTQ